MSPSEWRAFAVELCRRFADCDHGEKQIVRVRMTRGRRAEGWCGRCGARRAKDGRWYPSALATVAGSLAGEVPQS